MCKNRSEEQTSELTVFFMRGDMDLILTRLLDRLHVHVFFGLTTEADQIRIQGRQGCFHFFWLGLLIIGHHAELNILGCLESGLSERVQSQAFCFYKPQMLLLDSPMPSSV